MHLEFTHTFADYEEANQAYLRRTAVGGPARFGLLVIFMCVIVIGASAFFEAARPNAVTSSPSTNAPTAAPSPQAGGSFAAEFVLPLLPWLLVLAFLWFFVFRRLAPRKPGSFLFDSNADAERAGRQPRWRRIVVIAFVFLGFLALTALMLVNDESRPGDGVAEHLLSLGPWFVIFLMIWVFVFRLLRRQTRQNWEGQPNLHMESRIDISPDGVTTMTPVSSAVYRWEAFQRVQETPNLFILFLSTLTFVLVPKRALPDGEAVDSLRGMLRTMIAQRPAPAFAVVVPQQAPQQSQQQSSKQPPPLPR